MFPRCENQGVILKNTQNKHACLLHPITIVRFAHFFLCNIDFNFYKLYKHKTHKYGMENMEEIVKLHGLGFLGSLALSTVVYGISQLPLTEWGDDGIPRLWKTFYLLASLFLGGVFMPGRAGLAISGYSPPSPVEPWNGWFYGWCATFPVYLIIVLPVALLVLELPLSFGIDPHFYFTDVALTLFAPLPCIMFAGMAQRTLYEHLNGPPRRALPW